MLAITPCAHAAPLPNSPSTEYTPTAIDDSLASVVLRGSLRIGDSKPNIFAMGAAPIEVLFLVRR